MEIEQEYLKKLSTKREKRSIMLSYRRYRHLGLLHEGIGQEIFDHLKGNYTPKIWSYALSIYFYQNRVVMEPFSGRFFKLAITYEKVIDDALNRHYIHIELTDCQVEKQLKFMGYKRDLKTHDLYAYVSSNREINGHWWIHPKKYVDNIESIKKRPSIPYIYDNWDHYALEGYTKIKRHG